MAVALGYLLLPVPNVELVTFTVFASGVALGRWRGALVGALAMTIYSGLNPYGSGLGVPTMFAAQVLASAVTGLIGGAAASLWRGRARVGAATRALAAGGLGLVVTALYQTAVIVGLAAASPEFRTGAIAVIVSNAFFSVLHLASNTIVFAVLGPSVLPRVVRLASARLAAAAAVALLILVPVPAEALGPMAGPVAGDAAGEGGAVPVEDTPADNAVVPAADDAPADTMMIPSADETPVGSPLLEMPAVLPGGDVRVLLDGGVESTPNAPAGVRKPGSGFTGHHVAAARGALPPALTELTVRGRPASDWTDGGLDLLSASAAADGAIVALSGRDLSLWPARTSQWAIWGDEGSAPLALSLRPLRQPAAVPFSRVTASNGADGLNAFSAEFGRRFAGGTGAAGLLESERGDSPVDGGGFELARAGATAEAYLDAGWTVGTGGLRFESTRSTPVAGRVGSTGDAGSSTSLHIIRSDYFLRGESDALHLEFFHTQSWLERDDAGPSVRSVRDGLFASASALGPLDRAVLEVSRSEAVGRLLAESDEAVGVRAEIGRSVPVGEREASLIVGVCSQGEHVIPLGRATLRDASGWRLDALLTGRHPTVLERRLAELPLPGGSGEVGTLAGSPDLEPERAAAVEARWSSDAPLPWVLASFGAWGQAARMFGPVALEGDDGTAHPVNAADESAASLSLWADAGDTASLSGRLDVSLFLIDEDGALNMNAPVPVSTARASLTLPVSAFEGYVLARITAVLEHESGLARGPWEGLVEDSRVCLSVKAVGEVGSARLFVLVRDILSTDTARVPGMDPGGPLLSAGFSWRFVD